MKVPPCSICSRPASIALAYAARRLCTGCFVKHFEKRFLRTVREFGMIRPGEKIAVGVSGGKDSMVLLSLLAKLRKSMPFRLVAICVDEGIKGYRPRTLAVAKKECKKLRVPIKIITLKGECGFSLDEIMEMKGANACSWCGVLRRHALNRVARLAKADKVAVGHNLDDIAQSVLMNLMRNEPVRLARMLEPLSSNPRFAPRIRPLLRSPEKEVAAYALLRGMGIDYIRCPYVSGSFRRHVKRQLNETEERYPGTKQRILNSFLEMQKWLRKGMENVKFEAIECERCGEPSSAQVCMRCRMLGQLGEVI